MTGCTTGVLIVHQLFILSLKAIIQFLPSSQILLPPTSVLQEAWDVQQRALASLLGSTWDVDGSRLLDLNIVPAATEPSTPQHPLLSDCSAGAIASKSRVEN